MKMMLGKMAAAMLMAVGAAGTAQAENGSENLMNFHVRQQAVANQQADLDSVQRSVQLVKENPTAAGPTDEEQVQSVQDSSPPHVSPIQRDRIHPIFHRSNGTGRCTVAGSEDCAAH